MEKVGKNQAIFGHSIQHSALSIQKIEAGGNLVEKWVDEGHNRSQMSEARNQKPETRIRRPRSGGL